MKLRKIFILLAVFALPAWASAEECRDVPIGNAFVLCAAHSFDVRENDTGIKLTQKGVRSPLLVSIVATSPREFRRPMIGPDTRTTRQGVAIWRLDEQAAEGSGGANWTLKIDLERLEIIASKQNEFGAPDFEPVWKMIDALRPVATE